MMKAIISFMLGVVWTASASEVASPAPASTLDFFEKKIRPVLAEHCYECHAQNSKKLRAGLHLDSRAGLLQGGDTGVAIVLGEPDKSRLIEAIRYTNPDFQMPPKRKLDDKVVADLAEWVRQGAPWPEEEAPEGAVSEADREEIERKRREHWAWQTVRLPEPPPVKDSAWPNNDIDRFILAKLEANGLAPAPPADSRVLIRRVFFDLIGLPPSREEVEDFVRDPSPEAFTRVVDQLLASPHYGERIGRHWLDVARYGEDQAHNFRPRLYPEGYRYRDWLVQALNRDLPYDRFALEQIAGDLLPEDGAMERAPALGFFALGPVYYGDSKMFDQLEDRVDTLTRGFLGLTVACARCHDHKYDPVGTEDYYALAGVFASSEYFEAPLAEEEVVRAYEQAQSAIQAKNKEIEAFLDAQTASMPPTLLRDTANYMLASWTLEQRRKTNPKVGAAEIAKEQSLQTFLLEKWVPYLARPEPRRRPELANWFAAAQRAGQDDSLDEASEELRAAAGQFQSYLIAALNLRQALEAERKAAKDLHIEPASPDAFSSQAALLDEFLGKDGIFTVPKAQIEKVLPADSKTRLAEWRAEHEQLQKSAPPKYPFAHSLRDRSEPRNLEILLRGNPETPGSEAPRRFLRFLASENAGAFTNGSGRLELARAVVDPANPLAARVMVNRMWQWHFGKGLVRTPSNFGLLGEPPTHPELLDFLARRFLESGWSMKALHREMVLSAAYQMSSRLDRQAQQLDPENKLLWRMNRRRLEVEAWRDALLAVSGNLDASLGGPSLDLLSAENRRRTFYAKVSRHDLSQLLRLFDFPDPNVTSEARTVTTVPLQQLFVLNSEFMARQSQALAKRLAGDPEESDASRIERAFLLVYGRPPTAEEVQLGLEFLNQPAPTPLNGAVLSLWEQYAQALLSANEFMFVD